MPVCACTSRKWQAIERWRAEGGFRSVSGTALRNTIGLISIKGNVAGLLEGKVSATAFDSP